MFHLIDSDNDLFILDKELSKGGLVAVDTEFRRRGKEEIDLSLIQVNDSEETFIIDCLKIGKYKNNCKFLSSDRVKKIFHSCREDLDAIFSWTQLPLKNVFDTQLANEFLGGSFSVGYQEIIKEKFGVFIAKDETRSNWIKRPLRESQLKYAASDVEHLIDLFNFQKEELDLTGKIDWFNEEIVILLNKILFQEGRDDFKISKNFFPKKEEERLLKRFNEIVVSTSKEENINSTMFFSKKSQRDFLKTSLCNGIESALSDISRWKKELLLEEIYPLFNDFSIN